MAEVEKMEGQLQDLRAKLALILRNAGPFQERMLNQQRFDSLRNSGLQGLTSPCDQEAVPRKEGGKKLATATRDSPPAVQLQLPPPPIQAAEVGQEAGPGGNLTERDPGGTAARAEEEAEVTAAVAEVTAAAAVSETAGDGVRAEDGGQPWAPAQDKAGLPLAAATALGSEAAPEDLQMEIGGVAGVKAVPQDSGLTASTDGQTSSKETRAVRGESGLPAGQGRRKSYASSSASSEDDSSGSSGGSGGRMITEIRQMESPLHAGFTFGNDLPPEDAPGGKPRKRSRRKDTPKKHFVTRFVYGAPEAMSVPCTPVSSLASPIPSLSATSPSQPLTPRPMYLPAPTFTFTQSIPFAFGSPSSPSQVPPLSLPDPTLSLHVSPLPSSPPPAPHLSQSNTLPPSRGPPASSKGGDTQVLDRSGRAHKGKRKGSKERGGRAGGSSRNFYSDVDEVEVVEEGGRRLSLPPQSSQPLPHTNPVRVTPAGSATQVQRVAQRKQVKGSTGGQGGGTTAPPLVPPVQERTYAGVVAGGTSVSGGPGSGDLQQQILGALMRGEGEVEVEGEVIRLGAPRSRYRPRENRRGGDFWSSPTGPVGKRRNVVRIQWCSDDPIPPRSHVVELLLDMGFRARDIFALIHPYNTHDFDVSFVRPEGLDLFWLNYDQAQNRPTWRGFVAIPISSQNDIKIVTVLTRNESLSCVDISTWLRRYGDIQGLPKKDLDEYGIWSGAWTYTIRLRRNGPTLCHIPSSAFLGRDRILVFYRGQPRVCHRCGDPSHFSANCMKEVCVKCGGVGHSAQSCGVLRCHLCGGVGHPFSKCPHSYANANPFEGAEEEAPGTSGGVREGVPVNETAREEEEAEETSFQERERAPERAGPNTNPVSEAPGDGELEVSTRRLDREDGTGWQTQGPRKGKLPSEGGEKESVPPPDQVAKGVGVASPLTKPSNRSLPLDGNPAISGDGDGEGSGPGPSGNTVGDAAPPSGGPIEAPGGGRGPELPDKELHQEGKEQMDMSICLKRVQEGGPVTPKSGRSAKKRAK